MDFVGSPVIVFGRIPTVDAVKTRLAAGIGREEATKVYCELAKSTFAEVDRYCESNAALWHFYFAKGSLEEASRWLSASGDYKHMAGCRSQSGGSDLGERIRSAFAETLGMSREAGSRGAIIIGTDAPDLRAAHLEAAAVSLRKHEAIIGPARDGGFWLLGLQAPPQAPLFEGIEWSTDSVRKTLLANAAGQGLGMAPDDTLPILSDIDTADDFAAWRASASA